MADKFDKSQFWNPKYPIYNGLFYFFQGFYLAAAQIYILYKTTGEWNLDPSFVSILNMLIGIPLYLKMFTGLLSDRVPWGKWGRRKPYLMMGAFLYIPAFVIFSFTTDFNFLWIIAAILQAWLWVLVDGALDALACDVTPDEHMGIMNGVAGAGRCFGMVAGALLPIIASNVFGISLNDAAGWSQVILFVGLCAILMTISGVLIKEPPITREELIPIKILFKKSFSKEQWWGFIFILALVGCGGATNALKNNLIPGLGLSVEELSFFTIAYYSAGIPGSIMAGKLSDKLGHKRTIYISLMLFWVMLTPWILITSGTPLPIILLATFIIGAFDSMVFVCSARTAMALTNPELGGFMYSTYMSFHNFGGAIGFFVIGRFYPFFGYPIAWFFAIPFSILAVMLLPKIKIANNIKTSEG